MNVKLTAVAIAGVLVGGLIAVSVLRPTGGPVSGELPSVGKALIGGPFTLTDHTGKRVTDADFRGRNLLVFFGFTYCPDICPSGLAVITAALNALGPAAANITPVFVTIDPERDTPEKMAVYIQSFHPRLVGLTGTPAEIAAIIKAYRVYAKKVPDERNPASYTMDHSSIAYLMGPDGAFKTFFPELTKPDALAAQLRSAL
jgi:protein SCO1/2